MKEAFEPKLYRDEVASLCVYLGNSIPVIGNCKANGPGHERAPDDHVHRMTRRPELLEWSGR